MREASQPRQRGVGLIAYFAVAMALAAASAGAYAFFKHYQGVLEDRATAKQALADALEANEQQELANAKLQDDIKTRDRLLLQRERARQLAVQQREDLNAQLKVLRDKPEVAAWMDARVPDAILGRLRNDPAGAGDGDKDRAPVPAGEPPPAKPAAGDGGQPQRGPARVGLKLAGYLASLQR